MRHRSTLARPPGPAPERRAQVRRRAWVRHARVRGHARALGAAACGLVLAACAAGAAAPAPARHRGANSAAAANPALDTGSSLGGQPAPDIRLVNQFGQPMALSQFRGKVIVLAFVDSQCTNVCPLTTLSMLEAKQLLGAAGRQVQLLGVDANPRATSLADVMAYSRVHAMVNQWDFLTGTLAQLTAAWRAFHIAVQIQRGAIDHTPALFVIDQRGRERAVYLTQMSFASIGQAAQVMAQEVAGLLPGHPPLLSRRSLAYVSGIGPGTPVTLPGVPSGSVALGPGRPRLVMFFATWLAETSDLGAHLRALGAYARAARHGRLPGLVAVDEQTTEPSPGAAAAYLKGLGTPLGFPVAADTTGRLADGYGVADQPWFVLTSAAGKIVWHHDGWLSVAALEAAARRA
jgi:cytochrome oxidase Cu insertion factor (SCO1/SenC/PrrC family)